MSDKRINEEKEQSNITPDDNNDVKKHKKRGRSYDARTIHLKKSEGTTNLYEWVSALVYAVAIVVIILTFFLRLIDVSGPSMKNTLYSGDKVIITNFMYTPADGDIVVISHGAEYSKPIIKRVIATEGEKLSIDFKTGEVKVNGKVLDEPYIIGSTHSESGDIPSVIPKGKIFVMGDNREDSLDSRSREIGLIDVDDVIGRARFVLFPFSNFKFLG